MAGKYGETILGYTWSKHKNLDRSVVCNSCNKKFEVSPYRLKTAKFCSLKCRNKSYSEDKSYHRQHSDKTKKILSLMSRGSKNHNWCGGVSRDRHGGYLYIRWRIAVYKRDSYTCQDCGQLGGKLNADHIKPWSKFPSLRLVLSNGRTLCEDCHRKTDTYGFKARFYQLATNNI